MTAPTNCTHHSLMSPWFIKKNPTSVSVTRDFLFCYLICKNNQRLSRACIVHLVIKRTNWSYVKTMSCSGSHLGNHLDSWNQTAQEWSLEGPLFVMPIGNPRWLPPQVIVLTQDHMGKIQKYILLWSHIYLNYRYIHCTWQKNNTMQFYVPVALKKYESDYDTSIFLRWSNK
jgi:hypothetical protein